MAELPHPWGDYERLQRQLSNKTRIDNESWGLEAALDALLDGVQEGSTGETPDIERVVRTTARRERYRMGLRAIHLTNTDAGDGQAGIRAVEAAQIAKMIHDRVANDDWDLLYAVAEGITYRSLARRRVVSAGSLRVRVSRLRRALLPLAA